MRGPGVTPEQLRERTGFAGTSAVLTMCECDYTACEACVSACRERKHAMMVGAA